MSHACLIVAIGSEKIREKLPEQLRHLPFSEWDAANQDMVKAAADAIHAVVAWEMEPFDENGTCFKDGSRWDWWSIGGRYEGRLLGGEIIYRHELSDEAMAKAAEDRVRDWWPEYLEAQKAMSPDMLKFVWDLPPDATLESEIERAKSKRVSAYAFLRNRRWCENGRLGWWGATAKTECEVKAEEKGDDFKGRCIHKDEASGAQIVTFNDDEGQWGQKFFDRFISDLEPNTMLVVVDYHV